MVSQLFQGGEVEEWEEEEEQEEEKEEEEEEGGLNLWNGLAQFLLSKVAHD